MNANRDQLLKKASSFFVLVSILSAWVLYRLVASAGGGPSLRVASPAGDAAPPLLRRSDSLYGKLNLSTTPIVVEEYKLLYFGIEKVGSTVLKQLMRRMMGHENYLVHGRGMPHAYPKNGLRYLTHYGLREANEMMTGDGWTRAMFVRDPKERALSAYLMWAANMKHFPRGMVEKARNGLINETMVKGEMGLGKCCKESARGDFNREVLCLHHMRTFEGFLDMVGDPIDADEGDDALEGGRSHNRTAAMVRALRESPPCPDKHWTPVSLWRMEGKFYPGLNFVGHLETARWDIKRLLDRLHPDAWERFGASGWGAHGNESMFQSATVNHAKVTENYLSEHFVSDEIERRVEEMYAVDYDNAYLDLERVPVGQASWFYRERYLRRFGNSTKRGR